MRIIERRSVKASNVGRGTVWDTYRSLFNIYCYLWIEQVPHYCNATINWYCHFGSCISLACRTKLIDRSIHTKSLPAPLEHIHHNASDTANSSSAKPSTTTLPSNHLPKFHIERLCGGSVTARGLSVINVFDMVVAVTDIRLCSTSRILMNITHGDTWYNYPPTTKAEFTTHIKSFHSDYQSFVGVLQVTFRCHVSNDFIGFLFRVDMNASICRTTSSKYDTGTKFPCGYTVCHTRGTRNDRVPSAPARTLPKRPPTEMESCAPPVRWESRERQRAPS